MRAVQHTVALLSLMLISCGSSSDEADQIRADRELVRQMYGPLFTEVSEILFESDPIGINFETNTDEYEPEVGTILPRLITAKSSTDVRRIVHEEFVIWFGPETAGPETNYTAAAQKIWDAWQRWDRG